jgi:hypothetical protein
MTMTMHYWAIRPINHQNQNHRIERAATPKRAFDLAFGRGHGYGFEYKDMGTRISVIHSDKQRIALLKDPNNWVRFPDPYKEQV